jgi:DNA-binding NarL/FixJ family response regulator
LQALCRPYKAGVPYATPATNQQIANEIYLSVDSVKNHLRTLFHKFGVEGLPQNQKRTRLVELAFRSGLVSERSL